MKTSVPPIFLLTASALAACAGGDRNEVAVGGSAASPETPTQATAPKTVKTGAAIEFSHKLDAASLQSGGQGRATLIVREAYQEGLLTIAFSATPGVELHASSRAATIALDGADAHEVEIGFTLLAEGANYIDVVAMIDGAGGRTYSIPLRAPGAGPSEKLKLPVESAAAPSDATIVMPAVETIEN